MQPRLDDGVPRAGEILGGKYEVERVIAEGGMGVVLRAKHIRLGHGVAIKVLQPAARAVPEIAHRFEREARAAAQIRSANVARVIDVETLPDGSPYMVMELLEGHDLGVELERRRLLPAAEAVDLALAACAAMAEAHRLGIIHRDLKPSNLFLAMEGTRRTLKVLDFGISKITTEVDTKMTATNSVLGTPLYMSPEQVRSTKSVDGRTDVWSLGVVIYEMLSGEVPFVGESATAIAAAIVADDCIPITSRCRDLPPGLADVVMKALSKKPEGRYQTVDQLAEALEPFAPLDDMSRSRRSMSSMPSIVHAPASELVVPWSGSVSPDARTLAIEDVARPELKTSIGWTDARPAASAASHTAEAPTSSRRLVVGSVALAAVIGLAAGWTLMSRSGGASSGGVQAAPGTTTTATTTATSVVTGDATSRQAGTLQPPPTVAVDSAIPQAASAAPSSDPSSAPIKPNRPAAPRASVTVLPKATVAPAPPPVGLPSHI